MDSTQDSNDQEQSHQQVIQEEELTVNNETDHNQETEQINTSNENDTQTTTTRRVRNYRDLPREKKLFVGGLPDGITLQEFNAYFGQFGTITDSVVIHHKVTKTPRGFGFVSFDSIESVHAVLRNTFHYLKEKRVEVAKAVLVPEPRNNDNNHHHHHHDSDQASISNNTNNIITHRQSVNLGPGSYYYVAVPQYYYDPGLTESQLYSYGYPTYLITHHNYNNVPYYHGASIYLSDHGCSNYGYMNNNYGYYNSYNPSYLVLP